MFDRRDLQVTVLVDGLDMLFPGFHLREGTFSVSGAVYESKWAGEREHHQGPSHFTYTRWPLPEPTASLGRTSSVWYMEYRRALLTLSDSRKCFVGVAAISSQCHVEKAPLHVGWRRRAAGTRELPAASSQCHPITIAMCFPTGVTDFSPSIVQNR